MARRRKRRSKQHSGWGRWVGGGVILLLVLGLVALFGGYLWLRGYLRGPEFLALVNEKSSGLLEAESRFERFHWEGMHVRAPLFEADGTRMIRRVKAEDFETELKLGAMVRKKFRSSPFLGRRLHVEIDAEQPAPELPEPTGVFEFPGLQIDAVSGRVDFSPQTAVSWSNVGTNVQSGSAKGSYDIRLAKGTVRTPIGLFPEGKVNEVKARYFDRSLYVTEARFGVYDSGRLDLAGEVDFGDGAYNFGAQLRDVMCAEVVPEDWKKRLLGRVESDFTVQGKGTRAPVTTGNLVLHKGVLTALPVLDRLSAYADTTRFRRMSLTDAQLDFRHEGNRLELTEVVLASDGLTRLEGELTIVDDELDGRFQLGIAPGILARIPGAETKVFLPGREGLLWSPLRITGTLDDPKEDLSQRLIAAAKERMFEFLPEQGIWVLKESGRAAGEMATNLLEQGKEAAGTGAEIGKGVVEQGVDILRDGTERIGEGVGGIFDGILGGRREPEPAPETPEPEEK